MDKYHIVVVVGSNASNSNTSRICKRIFSNLVDIAKKNGIFKVSVFVSSYKDLKLSACKGCMTCFIEGKCPLDQTDLMDELKQEMLLADCIVFASPVYVNNISGAMKNIIDRIGYWTHTMYLAGKKGFILVNTDYSGLEESSSYLYYIMTQMGICVKDIFKYSFKKLGEGELDNFSKKVAKKIYDNLENDLILSNQDLEECFRWKKRIYQPLLNNKEENYEIEFWKENGLYQIKSYEEFLKRIQR